MAYRLTTLNVLYCSWDYPGAIFLYKGIKKARKEQAEILVASTGFEPAISALRGRRPKPLDDGAMLAGVEGVEPSHTVPETAVLPLDDTPITMQFTIRLIA